MIRHFLFAVYMLSHLGSFAQNKPLPMDSIIGLVENEHYELAKYHLKSVNRSSLSKTESLKYDFSTLTLSLKQDTNPDLNYYYTKFTEQKEAFKSLEVQGLVFAVNSKLIQISQSLKEYSLRTNPLIEENIEIAYSLNDPDVIITALKSKMIASSIIEDWDTAKEVSFEMKNIASAADLPRQLESIEFNLGIIHSLTRNKDSVLYYYGLSENRLKLNNDSVGLVSLYTNYGTTLKSFEDFEKSVEYYNLAKCYYTPITKLSVIENVSKQLADTYFRSGEFKEAAEEYKLMIALNDSLNSQEHLLAVQEMETRYQSVEKEKENLKLISKQNRFRYEIYALTVGIFLLLIIGYFIYSNLKKKERISEQEVELAKQQTDKLLKEQEMVSIDNIIQGQELERKRIAEELHDNLGSTLTTVRLYFENLKSKIKDQDQVFILSKTESLLKEAYEKIRNMSHERQEGVIASRGLVPAVQELANRISLSGQIEVDVVHYGMDKSLNNSLEITIFRVIQELLSNVVKHSMASECSINITAHEGFLNIIVEDNGQGFDATTFEDKIGMGLKTIEKRIEGIQGNFEVDSHKGRGTSINIDIPIT